MIYGAKDAKDQPSISGYLTRSFDINSKDGKVFSRVQSEIAASYSRTTFRTNVYDSNGDVAASANFRVHVNNAGTTKYIAPLSNGDIDLGTSTNKWKTLNGINPGALGMPDNSAYIDISANIIDRAYGANSFVAVATGWIAIGSFASAIQIADDTTGMATTGIPGSDGFASVFLPVRANDSIRVLINQTSTTFQSFKLFPCLGNV